MWCTRNAFAATSADAAKPGSVEIPAPGGAIAFYARSRPTNIYLAFPGSKEQIEIFDPNPKQALALVKSGAVTAFP